MSPEDERSQTATGQVIGESEPSLDPSLNTSLNSEHEHRQRRRNLWLAAILGFVALAFFFSAWLIDFESMSK